MSLAGGQRAKKSDSGQATRRAYGPLLLLLAARLAVGLVYSQVAPAWEAYDEDGHFAYADYLASHHSLVLPANDPIAAQIWEKFQPPLYYDLIAPLVGLFERGPTFQSPARNPYLSNGDAGVNYALHPALQSTQDQAQDQALRAGRAASVLISTLSVLPVFLAARRLWPRAASTRWLATGLYAFWPQFLFVGSMLSNDVLITALSALAVLLAVDLALGGFRLSRALAVALTVGLALLTKLNGAALIVLAAGALALSLAAGPARGGRRSLTWLGLTRLALAGAGLLLLVAGAVWVLNSLHFVTTQIFQLSVARDFVGSLSTGGQHNGNLVEAALAYAFRTFLASYGWGNLESFAWLYTLWAVGALLAVLGAGLAAGLALRGRQHWDAPTTRVYWLLAGFSLTVVALALALAIAQQNVFLVPGRYLLPALPAVCLLLAGAWRNWLARPRWRTRAWQAISLGAVLTGWAAPFAILAPAYARPPLQTAASIDTPVGAVFGGSLELLGYQGSVAATAGQSAQATLCWRALAPIAANQTLFLEVVGADGQGYGRLRTYPGHGNYPTSQWTPDTEFCEHYQVPIASAIPAPALAHLRVSWLAGDTNEALPVRLASGAAPKDRAFQLEFKVAGLPGGPPLSAHPANDRIGEQIQLTGYDLAQVGRQVRVTLRWQVLEDVTLDAVVFVHLRDTPSHALAQGDGAPVQGAYPTRLWQKGEIILDTHVLNLPKTPSATPLALYVGMVDTQTSKRLPAFQANGQELLNDEILLAEGLVFK